MKKVIFLIMLMYVSVNAQFKDQTSNVDIKSGIIKNYSSSLFRFFNSDNFRMNHSFDISYQTFGSAGSLALTTYTNSMFYKINDQLDIQADISLINSPYNSFGKNFSSKINGLYLSRAQINYRPSENLSFTLQYRNFPVFYNSYYYNSPFFYRSWSDEFYNEKER